MRWLADLGTEFGWRVFQNIVDPEDHRPFDPKEVERNMDHLAGLIQQGRKSEALHLCTALEKSGSVSQQALETIVYRLYQETLDSKSPFLRDIRRWRELKNFDEAESQLQQLLTRQPDNWAATLLLARLYAEDLGQPNRALALIQPNNKPSPLPRQFLKLARQSINDWGEAASKRAQMEWRPERDKLRAARQGAPVVEEISIDELLKNGQLATAIEYLENALKEQPQDAELWLKLAEAHSVYCADPAQASKVIRRMAATSRFTPEELESARTKLNEWQAARHP
ncbi:MAG TPA: tetratricopeptide repeat protein [Verrucomicrobiae bacterium]|nr:tetratricopeptide repeat protein [Verrucomicrobiae bacterium]